MTNPSEHVQTFLEQRKAMMAQAEGQAPPDLATMRAGSDAAAPPVPDDVTVTEVDAGGIPADWVLAPGADPDRRLLYLHGGGYVIMSRITHRRLASDISRASGCSVLVLDYRLAPEHQFPAQNDDALAAFRWIQANGPSGAGPAASTFIAGDSAGGGLTLSTTIAARDEGVPLPNAAVTLSAWTDVSHAQQSRTTRAATDPIFTNPGSLEGFSTHYVGADNREHPLASPIFADLHGLPPILMQVADAEVLLDDTLNFAKRAQDAGVRTTVTVEPHGFHIYHYFLPEAPETLAAIGEIGGFLRAHG
ncbi:MAG: alpha/beta hydrolase [Dehalococcoidia bacterium]|nr:alpha/beta hydrolase [Dehalococcoidia bacterium]